MHATRQRRIRRATDSDGQRAQLICGLHRSQHVRRAPTSGYSRQGVPSGEPPIGEIAPPGVGIVFRSLGRPSQSRFAAGNHALNQLWRHLKCRRTFGGVQDSQPPAGASADVEQPAAGPKPLHDTLHRLGNSRNLRGHRWSDLLIFLVDDGQRVGGR